MKRIIIFSKTNCPYCVSAKQFLSSKGYTFEEKMVGVNAGGYDDLVKNWNTIKEQYLPEQTFLAE